MLYLFDSIKREKKLIILLLYQYVQVILKLFYHMYLHIQIYCKPTFICEKISRSSRELHGREYFLMRTSPCCMVVITTWAGYSLFASIIAMNQFISSKSQNNVDKNKIRFSVYKFYKCPI